MKKFVFRLDPVLQQRAMEEEKAILEQAEAQQEYNDKVRLMDKTRNSLDRVLGEIPDHYTDSSHVLYKNMYINYLTGQLSRQQVEVNQAGEVLEGKRRAVTEARKNKLVLEKLKENQLRAFMDNSNMIEQKALDEMGTMQISRQKG